MTLHPETSPCLNEIELECVCAWGGGGGGGGGGVPNLCKDGFTCMQYNVCSTNIILHVNSCLH